MFRHRFLFSNDKVESKDIWMSTYGTTDYVLTNRYETWSELCL